VSEGPHSSRQGDPLAEGHGIADPATLAERFGAMARTFEAEDDTAVLLAEIVQSALQLVPGVQAASISAVIRRREVRSVHPSSDLPRRVDALQTQTGQGPCLDAIFKEQTVRVPDMATEQRWPEFARQAVDAGVRSMLSCQLYVDGDNLGALNMFSDQPNAFDDESEQTGLLLASHAAVAYAGAQKIDQLTTALDFRDLIGQAKGILMERHKVNAEQAFRLLSRISQSTHRPLRDLAHELTTTGRIDPTHANPARPQQPSPRSGTSSDPRAVAD